MKKLFGIIQISAILLIACQSLAMGQTGKKVLLFNGKNLNNWVFHLKDSSVDPSSVFTVTNGVISVKGQPFGYMRTKKAYSDYTLHVEWRWPDEPTNSGVFVHGQKPDTIWLRCVECQLAAGKAGDFVCMNGADMNERTDKSKRVVTRTGPPVEKLPGEWNTMEITCKGNTILTEINGVRMNSATDVNLSGGFICLQSEGKTVEFRNVWLTKL